MGEFLCFLEWPSLHLSTFFENVFYILVSALFSLYNSTVTEDVVILVGQVHCFEFACMHV